MGQSVCPPRLPQRIPSGRSTTSARSGVHCPSHPHPPPPTVTLNHQLAGCRPLTHPPPTHPFTPSHLHSHLHPSPAHSRTLYSLTHLLSLGVGRSVSQSASRSVGRVVSESVTHSLSHSLTVCSKSRATSIVYFYVLNSLTRPLADSHFHCPQHTTRSTINHQPPTNNKQQTTS